MLTRIRGASPAIIITGVVLIIIASAILFITSKLQPTIPLYLGSGVFDAKVAYTQDERDKGYAGIETIPNNQALILAYASDGKWPIWMKDMKVSIDIVWMSSDKKVVFITKNASPDGGEKAVYVPSTNARYVIELPAGTVANDAIAVGRSAIFDVKTESIQ
jgi:uncharacterized membrane protein (UPF0127 family)